MYIIFVLFVIALYIGMLSIPIMFFLIGLYVFMKILIAVCNITAGLLDHITGATNRNKETETDNETSGYVAYTARLEITSAESQITDSGYGNMALKKGGDK